MPEPGTSGLDSSALRTRTIKAPHFYIRNLLISVGLTARIMAGIALALRRAGSPKSVIFDRFDPVAIFSAQPGISVQGVTGSGSVRKREGGAFREWRGFIRTSDMGLSGLCPGLERGASDGHPGFRVLARNPLRLSL
jgi:hypothetical protein